MKGLATSNNLLSFFTILMLIYPVFTVYGTSEEGGEKTSDIMEKETHPLQIIPNPELNLSQSEDEIDRDISINVDDISDEAIDSKQMTMMSSEGADDIDIDGFPPEGMTILITKDMVTATFDPVLIEMNRITAPSIIDEIADLAKDASNGTVVVDAPPATPVKDLLTSQNLSEIVVNTAATAAQQTGEESQDEE